jgi:hypothetical protein
MKTILRLALAAAAVAGMASPADAHHSAAQFDATKCITLNGTVRTFEWRFPHSWVWLMVADKKGGTAIWGLEMPAPSQLVRIDPKWNKDALVKGQKVLARLSPLRTGQTGGLLNSVDIVGGASLHGAPNAFKCEEERNAAHHRG